MKVCDARYYSAHGVSGQNLAHVSGLHKGVAFKYVHIIAKLITTQIAQKRMGDGIFNMLPNYMKECRSRFHSWHAFPNVGGCIRCIDGTQVPYTPNTGECEENFKTYKDGHLCCVSRVCQQLLSLR